MEIKRSLGQWIKQYRIALGFTQAALAKDIGCATITLRKIEADERHPSRQMVLRIAACLSLTPDERDLLLDYWRIHDPEPRPEPPAPSPQATLLANSPIPYPTTPLVGRDTEVAQILARIRQADVRWITIAGPPGVGKTRIGLQVARELEGEFSSICWISLAHVTDPAALLPTIVQHLKLSLGVDSAALESLKQHLIAHRLLLVLDNMDQVAAVASDIAMLLTTAPQLVVIVTSRIYMLIPGEHIIPIRPFDTPPYEPNAALDQWQDLPAVRLFVQRAQAVDRGFALTSGTVDAVVRICRYLDGIPLALELAAARISLLPPDQLLLQLQQQMRVLADGAAGTPDHQSPLEAALHLSIGSLPPQAQRMLWITALFAGGWTLESAAAVWGSPSDFDTVESHMLTLLSNSLVMRDTTPASTVRFSMLETIREYALAQSQQSPELAPAMERYVGYYVLFAEQAAAQRSSPDQYTWCQRLTEEYPNIRSVLAWCVQHAQYELAARLAGGLWWFWWTITNLSEARHWYAILLEAQDQLSVPVRATLLFAAAKLSANPAMALPLYEQSLALYRGLEQPPMIADSLIGLGQAAAMQGLVAPAQHALTEALAIYEALGDEWGRYIALGNLGGVAILAYDLAGAAPYIQKFHAWSLTIGRPLARVLAEHSLGVLTLLRGEPDAARTIFTANAQRASELGLQRYIALSHHNLAVIALATDQRAEVLPHLRRSMRILADIGDTVNLLASFECGSAYLGALGYRDAAQRLMETVTTIRQQYRMAVYPVEQMAIYPLLTGLALDPVQRVGPPMDVPEAVRFATALLESLE